MTAGIYILAILLLKRIRGFAGLVLWFDSMKKEVYMQKQQFELLYLKL